MQIVGGKMKILVTGGCGFIGSHTCVELLDKGEQLVVVDNFCNSSPGVVQKIKDITNKYKRIQYMPSKSLNKNIKLLISEETMTSNNKKNCKNKNKDNDKDNYLDYLISTKKFDKYNSKKQNVHLNTYNFNYDEYCKNVKD